MITAILSSAHGPTCRDCMALLPAPENLAKMSQPVIRQGEHRVFVALVEAVYAPDHYATETQRVELYPTHASHSERRGNYWVGAKVPRKEQ